MTTALPTSPDPLSVTLSLLEVYETPVPPPGARAGYPVAHGVVRLRLENRSMEPVQIPGGHLSIEAVASGRSLLTSEVAPMSLGGLQIGEQGFHLTGPEPLNVQEEGQGDVQRGVQRGVQGEVQGAVQAVYRFTHGGVPYSVKSEPMAYPPLSPSP